MKLHVGTTKQGLVHSLATGPANEADISRIDELVHGEEKELYGDQAYWVEGHKEHCEEAGIRYRVNRRGTQSKPLTEYQRMINRASSRTRARGEHAFRVIKQLWGFTKVRYAVWRRTRLARLPCLLWRICTCFEKRFLFDGLVRPVSAKKEAKTASETASYRPWYA